MAFDLGADAGYAARLLLAALLGALVGLEREIHDHPAGMRTHLLVSLGSAAFTVLSIAAFAAPGADPGRIAAQIVSGIGFLGAGAILKEGATIRGLTTAASLWATAAVGMAAGSGAWLIGVTVTAIAIVSLWPLRLITDRISGAISTVSGCALRPPIPAPSLASSRWSPSRAGGSPTSPRTRPRVIDCRWSSNSCRTTSSAARR